MHSLAFLPDTFPNAKWLLQWPALVTIIPRLLSITEKRALIPGDYYETEQVVTLHEQPRGETRCRPGSYLQ